MVVLLAIVASITFGATGVTVKRGMQHTGVAAALIISLAVSTVIIGAVVLVAPPERVGMKGILLFAVAGLVGDGIGRLSAFTAINRLGPSTAMPIHFCWRKRATLSPHLVTWPMRIAVQIYPAASPVVA